jgi:hypothetical protein
MFVEIKTEIVELPDLVLSDKAFSFQIEKTIDCQFTSKHAKCSVLVANSGSLGITVDIVAAPKNIWLWRLDHGTRW